MQVIVEGLSAPIKLDHAPVLPYSSLKQRVNTTHQIDLNSFSVYLSGRLLTDESLLVDSRNPHPEYSVLRVQSRVLGGKGGFGSQLKAIGAQIHKTTSREACRDLSGRRVRDVNAEKRFQQLAREEKRRVQEREQQKARRRERRWAQRTTKPMLEDPEYYQSLEENEDRVSAALKHAQRMSGKKEATGGVSGIKRSVFRGMGDVTDSGSEDETGGCVSSVDVCPGAPSADVHTTQPCSEREDVCTISPVPPIPTNSHSESATPIEHDPLVNDDPIPSPHTEAPPVDTPLPDPIDLDSVSCKQELENLSLEVLKVTLKNLGLKCGGTQQERVDRLYLYKVTPKEDLNPSIFAGKGKFSKKLAKKS
eukprot:TRINITY_DN1437_c0_g1_i1.p1 TRINITY_DN1437_c0_g1~~TRINITY_DN1437_c0_g1_i1.p1  ORF type:complete len:364 (-),score=111.78 TRINITY_DN1437_c0_g1_i1:252-1343(-)